MSEKSREQIDQEVGHAKARLASARELLRRIPGVIDVFVGIREIKGHAAPGLVVFQVYVEEKRPLHQLAPEHRIPPVVADVPTDVIAREAIVPTRVLTGGTGISQGLCGGTGTLGAIGFATTTNTHVPSQTPLLLTNQHVTSSVGDSVGRVASCDCWCCACCDFGALVDARLTTEVDGAIGTLNSGVRYSHEILGIGAIRGAGVAQHDTKIIKFGQATTLTVGTVTNPDWDFTRSDGQKFVHQIRIAPDPEYPRMSDRGDSGSVYVNLSTRQVVGLHHAGDGLSFGNHIAPVMALLHIDFPVMGTAAALPLGGQLEMPEEPTMLDEVAALRAEFETTEVGQRWIELLRVHSAEVRYLVNHHRETKVAWHRTQGPAFVSHYLKSAREPAYRVPGEIGGTRIENTIVSMAAILQRYGSLELSKAISEHYLTALELLRNGRSAHDLVGGARRVATIDRSASRRQG